jgi:hypothetical protein
MNGSDFLLMVARSKVSKGRDISTRAFVLIIVASVLASVALVYLMIPREGIR